MSTTGVNWKIIFKTDAFMQHFYMFDWKKNIQRKPPIRWDHENPLKKFIKKSYLEVFENFET
jgi:hypothetical protein